MSKTTNGYEGRSSIKTTIWGARFGIMLHDSEPNSATSERRLAREAIFSGIYPTQPF
jgi:hypothetical protein